MVTIPWGSGSRFHQNNASRRSPAGENSRFSWWKLRFCTAIFEVFRTLYQQLIAHTPNTSKYSKKLIFPKYFKISPISPNTSKSQDWTWTRGGGGGGSCFTHSEVFDPYVLTLSPARYCLLRYWLTNHTWGIVAIFCWRRPSRYYG